METVINTTRATFRWREGALAPYEIGEVPEQTARRNSDDVLPELETFLGRLSEMTRQQLQVTASRAGVSTSNASGDQYAFIDDVEDLVDVLRIRVLGGPGEVPDEVNTHKLYSACKSVEGEARVSIPTRAPQVLWWYLEAFGEPEAFLEPDEPEPEPEPEEANKEDTDGDG